MSFAREDHLPPPVTHGMDAPSSRTTIDHYPNSKDERRMQKSRNVRESNDYGSPVPRQEEELENLLTKNAPFRAMRHRTKGPSRRGFISDGAKAVGLRGKERRSSRLGPEGERAERGRLITEEEGFEDSSSRSSSSELGRLGEHEWTRYGEKLPHLTWQWLILVPSMTVALFVLLVFGAYTASSSFRHAQSLTTLSNGSHVFAPTTILISLDGFRADFLDRGLTPALNSFIASGVSPEYMLPSFPSVTFPNHFTLVTGLYPETHGVVGNTFWDPDLDEEFYYTDPLRSMQPKWWTGEPLWVTAEIQGIRTAVHMWPGSEAHIPPLEPTYLDRFNDTEALAKKAERILGLLDLPGDLDVSAPDSRDRRPQLIAAYVPNVDAEGHRHGPNSSEIRETISDVDSMLAILMDGLYYRNLTEVVNLVVVSDHGMATTSNTRLIQLDDLMDLSLVDHIDGWPLRGLRLKNPSRDVPILYEQLLAESKKSQGFDVYNLQTMPERYHFTNNKRIAPLWIIPRTGWAVVERTDFDVAKAKAAGTTYHPIGLHGYDHEHPLMRAIFVARGPAFPHAPNSRVPVFQNIEVYNIICDSLGIKPHANNGSLRLPLKTEGFHRNDDTLALEMSDDVPQETSSAGEMDPDRTERPKERPPFHPESSTSPTEAEATSAEDVDGEADKPNEGANGNWWKAFHDQIERAKEWAKKVLAKLKSHGEEG